VTDDEMARVASILRRQLRAASPETYRFTWELVFNLYADFDTWLSGMDPEFLPDRFYNLIFEDYPIELHG